MSKIKEESGVHERDILWDICDVFDGVCMDKLTVLERGVVQILIDAQWLQVNGYNELECLNGPGDDR